MRRRHRRAARPAGGGRAATRYSDVGRQALDRPFIRPVGERLDPPPGRRVTVGAMPVDWFAVYAPAYDAFVRLAGVAPVAPLLELVGLRGDEAVLDVGGGTGRVAAPAAALCREVVVLDPCGAMLRRAPALPNLRTVAGRAQALPFGDGSFDVVLCVDALHHVKDAPAAAAEIRRVLRPGGRVLVQEFDVRAWRGRVVAALERLFVDDSRFLDPGELERIFAAQGLEGEARRRSWLEYAFLGRKVR